MNEAEVGKWAKAQGIAQTSRADLCVNDQVVKLIETEVKRLNEELAHCESIKKVTIVPADFTVETGELTPSLKLKRKAIIAKYKGSIEKMYRA